MKASHTLYLLTVSLMLFIYGCSSSLDKDYTNSTKQVEQGSSQQIVQNNTESASDRGDIIQVPLDSDVRHFVESFKVPGVSVSEWESGVSKGSDAWLYTNTPLVSLQIVDDSVENDIGVSDNGLFMVSVGSRVNIWSLNLLNRIRSWELDSIGIEIKLSPDGKIVATSHDDDNKVRIWQQKTGFKIAEIKHNKRISAIAISPMGQL